MLLSTAHQRVLIDATPEITQTKLLIPGAADFNFGDKQYVTFPHGVAETRILRSQGYDVPSPIMHYFDWPGNYVPMGHQSTTASFLTLNPRAFVLNDIGTGKTLSMLWAADFLMKLGIIRRVLVAAPLSTLVRVWGDAIFQHFPHRSHVIMHDARATRIRMLNHDFDFFVINHDGVNTIADALHARDDFDLLILDELAVYRNGQTQRWKIMQKMIKPQQWVWGATGAPTPNLPTDAYAQAKLVNPWGPVSKYNSFTAFRNACMIKESMYVYRPAPNANEMVFDILQPSIRFSREECLSLPPCTTQTLEVELTPEQKKAYKDLMNEFATEINGSQVTAMNEAIKLMRLVQVVSGTLYDVAGVQHVIPAQPRMAVIKEIIEGTQQKVIIFCPFTGNLKPIIEQVAKWATCEMVYGDTPKSRRDAIFDHFQRSQDPRVLVAHPACMAHGLTLTSAATIVWWAPHNSHDIYEQANGRINRQGQEHPTTIIHIAGTAVERRIYKRLQDKAKFQGMLLEMVEEAKRL